MAKHERDIQAQGQEELSLAELLDLLGPDSDADSRARQHAIACYLSASDGWREAVKRIGGAFAKGQQRLREDQSD